MRDAYAELGREPGTPLAGFDDAFKPCDQLVLYDRQGDGWHGHSFDCPRNFLRPGDAGELPTFWEIAAEACGWALMGWRWLREERPRRARRGGRCPFVPEWFEDLAARAGRGPARAADRRRGARCSGVAERLARRARAARPTTGCPAGGAAGAAGAAPEELPRLALDWWCEERCDDEPRLRFFFTTVDAGVSTLAGVVEDGVLEHGFDAINDQEWSAWLARHGAKEITLGRTPEERAPVLRSVYDVAFGYPGGSNPAADVAAGTATSDLLRLAFSYRGSIMYKMQAGMGDAVFTPLYEVLRARGVRFKFFHAVTALRLGRDESGRPLNRIDKIDVVEQAKLAPGRASTNPLRASKGLECWPSEPLWDQLETGRQGPRVRARAQPARRGRAHARALAPGSARGLRRGRARHPGRRARADLQAS